MKKHKIAMRVFKMISLLLVVLLSTQIIFQTLFLEKLYIHNKKMSISKEVQALTNKVVNLPESEISKELRLFSQKFGATTGIVDLSGIPLYGFDSQIAFMEVETKENVRYKVYLSSFLENESFKEQLQPNNKVSLKTLSTMSERESLYPRSIAIGDDIFSASSEVKVAISNIATPVDDVRPIRPWTEIGNSDTVHAVILSEAIGNLKEIEIEGKIKDVYIPGEEVFGNGYRENKILEDISYFIQKARINGTMLEIAKPIIDESIDTYVGIRNIISITPIIVSGEVRFLVSMTSLEQVEEAIEIMNQCTFVIFIVALIVAVLLAYWYSKKLTSPLVELKDVTTAITNLDFSQICYVKSEDEIGELAYNINLMSFKLKTTLEKLQEDMAFKEKLSNERKQFIIDVSHELKTPLTVLKATCEGFRDNIYEHNNQAPIQNMLYQIDTMSELVQELLTVVRLEKEQVPKEEVFDLCASFFKIYSGCKSLAKEKNITTHIKLEESIVIGDRKKIEIVMRNFYNNAAFYTPKGGEIFVKGKRQQDKWLFSIENSGAFIDETELEKIWEPFYRIDKSRNKELGGSGLGLYIVRKILDAHGVGYGIENTTNGVRAWFTLQVGEE